MELNLSKNSLEAIIQELNHQVIPEYRFNSQRRFRFDYFIPVSGITGGGLAVEYEGIFSGKSRHTSLKGYSKDCEKYNLALTMGIPVLRFTALQLKDPEKIKKDILQTLKAFTFSNLV